MSNKNEFLLELRVLLKKYNAEIRGESYDEVALTVSFGGGDFDDCFVDSENELTDIITSDARFEDEQ